MLSNKYIKNKTIKIWGATITPIYLISPKTSLSLLFLFSGALWVEKPKIDRISSLSVLVDAGNPETTVTSLMLPILLLILLILDLSTFGEERDGRDVS
jgi:hypothetical protein